MKLGSLTDNITYMEKRPAVQVLFETPHTKEIRIVMKKGQYMKEHKTPFPIVVEVFRGSVDFGSDGMTYHLLEGGIITLPGNVLHDLTAKEDSIIRLSISTHDRIERVKNIAVA